MNIYINGTPLQIPAQEVNITSKAVRFNDVLTDEFSTDIALPKTPTNCSLLGVYMLLEGNSIGCNIPCVISYNTVSSDGYVKVTKVTDTEITITAFIAVIPSEMLDKNIQDVVPDNEGSIIQWDNGTATAAVGDGYGLWPYYQGVKPTIISQFVLKRCKPSIKLSKLFARITDETGIQLPEIDSNVVLTASRMVESKANMQQVMYLYTADAGEGDRYNGSSPWSLPNDDNDGEIIMTCNADLSIHILYHAGYSAEVMALRKRSTDGTQTWVDAYDGSALDYEVDVETSVTKGQMLKWMFTGNHGSYAVATIKYSNVTNVDEDEDEHEFLYHDPQTIQGVTEVHFNHYGIITNLAKITLRQLLSSVAWHLGQTIEIQGSNVQLVDADNTVVLSQYTIKNINSASDTLAKTLVWTDSEDTVMNKCTVAGDYLEDSKTIHKSSFLYPRNLNSAYYCANIPEYKKSATDSTGVSTIEENSFDGIPISIPQNLPSSSPVLPTGTWLRPVAESQALYVSPSRALGIEVETYEDVSSADFIMIDQHKFAIVEVDTDADTRLSTIKAIQI